MPRNVGVAGKRQGRGQTGISKGHKETFGGNGYVHCLGGVMSSQLQTYAKVYYLCRIAYQVYVNNAAWIKRKDTGTLSNMAKASHQNASMRIYSI